MIIHILWFALGLVLLIKGGDWFVDGAAGVAKRSGIPDLLIGATVVSIGTTLPEVMVSATSAAQGYGAMAYGNAIGSIICNTSFVAALTVALKPQTIDRNEFRIPVMFFFAAAALYAGVAYISGDFSRTVGIVLLCMFAGYMTITVKDAFAEAKRAKESLQAEAEPEEPEEDTKKEMPLWKMIVLLIIGAATIALGSKLLVDHGVALAEGFGVPQTVISLTFVALGTSLPELVTAITSLRKGHGALSLGNICGANLFNLVLVSGISITIGPFTFAKPEFQILVLGGKEYFSSLIVDTPLMIIVMAILTLPALAAGKLKRWQGILLLAIYAAFCTYQFM